VQETRALQTDSAMQMAILAVEVKLAKEHTAKPPPLAVVVSAETQHVPLMSFALQRIVIAETHKFPHAKTSTAM
tara:strand:- start:1344 stop:1565 length:222 start_codon:yes stop_codon:yes gene_type:complete